MKKYRNGANRFWACPNSPGGPFLLMTSPISPASKNDPPTEHLRLHVRPFGDGMGGRLFGRRRISSPRAGGLSIMAKARIFAQQRMSEAELPFLLEIISGVSSKQSVRVRPQTRRCLRPPGSTKIQGFIRDAFSSDVHWNCLTHRSRRLPHCDFSSSDSFSAAISARACFFDIGPLRGPCTSLSKQI